jgi:nucleoside-diphosphate-sugar epimerase
MAKILITGGTGFIGTNLYNELIKRDHEVVVSDLKSSHL